MNKIIFITMFAVGMFVLVNVGEARGRNNYTNGCVNGACSIVKDLTSVSIKTPKIKVDIKKDKQPILAPIKKIKAKTTVKTETTEVKVEAEVKADEVGLPHPIRRIGGILKRIFGR